MVECQEFVGKVVSSFKLYEDSIEVRKSVLSLLTAPYSLRA